MTKADMRGLRDLSVTELQQRARETKEELFNLRFQLRTGHLSDFSRVKAMRHLCRDSNGDQREANCGGQEWSSLELERR